MLQSALLRNMARIAISTGLTRLDQPTSNPSAVSLRRPLTRRDLAQHASGIAVLLAGAACGRATGPASSGDAGGGRKALPPAKVTFFTHWGAQHQLEGQQQTLAAFEQDNPGITVEMVTNAATAEKVVSAVAAGEPPDLVAQSAGRLIPLALKSVWRPLEDMMKGTSVVKRENYSDVQLKLFTWKGKLYGIPAFEHSGLPALAYNIAHFEEVGLDPSKPPRTPTELMATHEKLTSIESGSIRRLGIDPRDASGGGYGSWAAVWGVTWWDPDALKLELNQPGLIDVHNFVVSFYRQDRATQIAEFRKQYATWTQAKSGIALGTQSMQLNGYWTPGELRMLPEKPARMGYTWWPNPKAEKVAIAQGWSGAIPADAKLPEHGWRLLEFFASVKGGQIMFDTIGWLNGSKQFLREGKFDAVPDLKFFLDMPAKADRSEAGYATPIQGEIDEEYQKGMTAVIAGQQTVKAMFDDLQTRMKQKLEEALQ